MHKFEDFYVKKKDVKVLSPDFDKNAFELKERVDLLSSKPGLTSENQKTTNSKPETTIKGSEWFIRRHFEGGSNKYVEFFHMEFKNEMIYLFPMRRMIKN